MKGAARPRCPGEQFARKAVDMRARYFYVKGKAMTPLTVKLVKDKTTPGTVRFSEESRDHPINIYLTKERVKQLGEPETITLTISAP